MKVWSDSFADNAAIDEQFAFGKPDAQAHVALSQNKNPHLAWSDAPAGTRSFVVICTDSDVPSQGDDVNQEGREVPATLPRVDFYHWVLVDVPASVSEIPAAGHSNHVTPRGKFGPDALDGMRHGINDYTAWFAGDESMRGDYYGYDGPCPPWNDTIVHHYHFTVYALDIARVPLDGRFGGDDVLAAIQPHVLGQARVTGTYTLNPALA
ncbi:YbhB/YbcL family Raf kinase inhibitor-like protein [Pandoraea sp. XY-2]|uniref:YbhB/YbcL family Raf kinase inhibitor-like protein n=1 Tax=Pandoraea sp. XY-2 TaxID=2518599 RepID=UPI00101B01C3|nr:YbhB/YbcL family Raf kinase inhibitor-like protein [Pandoraea sp. XY-2]QBC30704.1 phospholipid-binding protein [Pandoraea sp. XY-2]